MLYGAEVAVHSQINTKHINAVWAESTINYVQLINSKFGVSLNAFTSVRCTETGTEGLTL
jgi:hypothetical protein